MPDHVFADGYNDQILSNKRNLNALYNYIRSNPRHPPHHSIMNE